MTRARRVYDAVRRHADERRRLVRATTGEPSPGGVGPPGGPGGVQDPIDPDELPPWIPGGVQDPIDSGGVPGDPPPDDPPWDPAGKQDPADPDAVPRDGPRFDPGGIQGNVPAGFAMAAVIAMLGGGDCYAGPLAVSNRQALRWTTDRFGDSLMTDWTGFAGTWNDDGTDCRVSGMGSIYKPEYAVYHDATAAMEDGEVSVELPSGGVDNGVVGRFVVVSGRPYGYGVYHDGAALVIRKFSGFSSAVLATVAATVAAGDRVGMRLEGTTIRALHNGVVVAEVTDATYTVGHAGMMVSDTSSAYGEFDTWRVAY